MYTYSIEKGVSHRRRIKNDDAVRFYKMDVARIRSGKGGQVVAKFSHNKAEEVAIRITKALNLLSSSDAKIAIKAIQEIGKDIVRAHFLKQRGRYTGPSFALPNS